MTKTRRTTIALAATAAGAAAATLLAGPSQAATSMTFTARSIIPDTQGFVDANHSGVPDAGDYLLVADTLYNAAGKAVGYDRGTCTIIRMVQAPGQSEPTPETMCVVTAALPAGQLVATGIDKSGGTDVRVAVTGGTGDYTGRGGTVHSTAASSQSTTSTLTIVLQ